MQESLTSLFCKGEGSILNKAIHGSLTDNHFNVSENVDLFSGESCTYI